MPRTIPPIKTKFFAIAAFALYVLFPTYTYAQSANTTTNDQEAQRLKASFQNLLDYQKSVNEIFASSDITYDGELTITRQPTYYTLTFPHIYIGGSKNKANNEDESQPSNQVLDIGVITINAMADEKPGYWKIVLTLPEKFALYDAQKASGDPDIFSLNIGEQRTIALYSEKLGYFTKMDLNLSSLGFLVGGQKVDMEMGGLQFYTKLEEQDDGKFSGPGHFLINNLKVFPPNQSADVDIEELKLSFHMGDFALPTLKEYGNKLLKHKDTFDHLKALEDQDNAENISSQNVFDMLADMYDFDMGSFSFAYSTKNANIKEKPTANNEEKAPETNTIHIADGRFGIAVSGLKTDDGALRIELDYNGFKTTPEDPEISDLVPQNLSFNTEAQKVPFNTLTELASNTFQSIAENPQAAQMAGLGVIMRLPAIISQAGTQVVVSKNNISNHIYDVTLDGKITPDLSSMIGFAAKFNLLFEGLDALLNVSQKHSAKENGDKVNEYKNLVTTLQKLKTIGQSTTGKNKKPAYSYTLELGQQGQFTINGHDAQTVFGPQQEQQ